MQVGIAVVHVRPHGVIRVEVRRRSRFVRRQYFLVEPERMFVEALLRGHPPRTYRTAVEFEMTLVMCREGHHKVDDLAGFITRLRPRRQRSAEGVERIIVIPSGDDAALSHGAADIRRLRLGLLVRIRFLQRPVHAILVRDVITRAGGRHVAVSVDGGWQQGGGDEEEEGGG